MEYTEEEKKGIDKVERMNRLFDKIILPAIGILIIFLLISFTVNRFRDKFGSDESSAQQAVSRQNEQDVFQKRREILNQYYLKEKAFASYGYRPVEGYAYELSLGKTVDDELTIFQFSDAALGTLTIINYTPKNVKSAYQSLSLAVSSPTLINVTVKKGEQRHVVTFTSTDFSSSQVKDKEEYKALLKLTSMEDIQTMYEIFITDINHLYNVCNE